MNYAGLRFVLSNYMNYEHMLTVFNLVLFSLTFGTQALDFGKRVSVSPIPRR
jgi:ATP-binding cassette subfamily B (MDR/TAP) protein 1